MALRRAATLVGSASAVGAAALGGSSAKAEAAPKYGWEGAVPTYGGAGDVKPGKNTKKVVSHMSTVPDEWKLFREATRAQIILDKLDEADAEIVKRPMPLKVKAVEGVDLSIYIDKACHRQSNIEWKAYEKCVAKKAAGVRGNRPRTHAPRLAAQPAPCSPKQKAVRAGARADLVRVPHAYTQSHEACNGWFTRYTHAMETCSYKTVLKVLNAMTEDDPDPNVQKTREGGGWSFLQKPLGNPLVGGPEVK